MRGPSKCGHLLDRGLQGIALAPLDDGDAERVKCRSPRITSEQPEPLDQGIDIVLQGAGFAAPTEAVTALPVRPVASARRERHRRDLDHGHVESAAPEIGERGERTVVQQRGERHDERLRGKRSPRDDVDVLPGVAEHDLGVEQRVDDAVALHDPGRRCQPVEDPAEDDEADTVTVGEVALGERGGRTDREIERPCVLPASLDEGVEEDDDVRVALRVELVDPAARRTGRLRAS